MNWTHLIYGLYDPNSGMLRYVGLSTRGMERPKMHRYTKKYDRSHRACWLRSLHNVKLQPDIRVLQYTDTTDEAVTEAEKYWIAYAKSICCPLVNHQDGGFKGKPDQKTINKSRDARIAKTHCRHGHEYTLENTMAGHKFGTRRCRTCLDAWNAEHKAASDHRQYINNREARLVYQRAYRRNKRTASAGKVE